MDNFKIATYMLLQYMFIHNILHNYVFFLVV